uniref:Myb-like domain-containing protein n=1 Tax=Quercus lobata TaxID=97700 RepID=A0A7N2N7T9_QUELO
MDDFPKVLCGWSWEENKLFELALAVVDEEDPDRWEMVAAMVGGKKSAEDVQKHYVILLEDLQVIESGKLDHKLGEAQPCGQVDCTQPRCWTDEDNKLAILEFYDCKNEAQFKSSMSGCRVVCHENMMSCLFSGTLTDLWNLWLSIEAD